MKRFVWGFVTGVIAVALVPVVAIGFGLVNMSAAGGTGPLEAVVAPLLLERSMAVHAEERTNPLAGNEGAKKAGMEAYAEMCVHCHGAPGVEPAEFARGLQPPAPDLAESQAELRDGELFWLVSHGVRLSAMPAFSELTDEPGIWQVVTFLRHLPELSPGEREDLAAATGHGHH
jgi:mono/diheme cytochrome c family protein